MFPFMQQLNLIFLQMQRIRWGLEDKIDVSIYAKPEFNYQQMDQIRLGIEKRVDIILYLNPGITWMEMRRIRLELESNNE